MSALLPAGVGLTVLTQLTGLFYTITGAPLPAGEGFGLSQAIRLAALALVGGRDGPASQGQAREERELLPAYVLLPMGILAAELLWTEITLLGIGATLTLVLVFVNVHCSGTGVCGPGQGTGGEEDCHYAQPNSAPFPV